MIYWVQRPPFHSETIGSIDDTAAVGVYVYTIGSDSDGNRLFLNGGLPIFYLCIDKSRFSDFDVGGFRGRVKAVR